MEKKRISISSKRQITIPQRFFDELGFKSEAEIIIRGKELIIRPIKEYSGSDFSEQILSDLIEQGYNGDELLSKFKETQKKVGPAIEAMVTDAEQVASGKGVYDTYDDVFGTENFYQELKHYMK